MTQDPHLLRRLAFPARYESLESALGAKVAQVLVAPEPSTLQMFQRVGLAIPSRGEGLFLPLFAASGTGKTTLASNLSAFLGEYFAETAAHDGPITPEDLLATVDRAIALLPTNDTRVVPILIDNRESNEATDAELAALKQFLRTKGRGARSAILWPETSHEVASSLSERYTKIVGSVPVTLPLDVAGPVREAWQATAISTFRLVNGLNTLQNLGVNPADYAPEEYASLGDFIRAISDDFTALVHEMLLSTALPVGLVVLFGSSSPDAGILSHLTTGTEFGLLDPNALVDATPNSVIGRWWGGRRGLLTQTVVRLDARAFCLPPSLSIPTIRRYGHPTLSQPLTDLGVTQRSEAEIVNVLARSDVGRYLAGETRAAFETRGTPATTSDAGFALLASEIGFSGGRDKLANRAFAELLKAPSHLASSGASAATAEEALPFASLIPDIRVDRAGSYVCVEIAWRKGDYLDAASRSDIAQYLLTKLRNYGRELRWIAEDD